MPKKSDVVKTIEFVKGEDQTAPMIMAVTLEKAAQGEPYYEELNAFKRYQAKLTPLVSFSEEFAHLEKLFEGVSLLGDYSDKIKDFWH